MLVHIRLLQSARAPFIYFILIGHYVLFPTIGTTRTRAKERAHIAERVGLLHTLKNYVMNNQHAESERIKKR